MLKLMIVLATIITVLAAVVIIRTFTYPFEEQVQIAPVERREVDADTLASHLAEAVRFQTISHQKPADNDANEILAFHRWLEETYPAAHRVLKREIVNEHSLLYTWKGQNASLEPVIFLAHMDVVPVDPDSVGKWTEPPFGGTISGGFIWGRGTLDMKGILVAIMEAVELQVTGGHQPQRTILLGFGHDEEVGGRNGAAKIAKLLKSRGVRLKWIIDEGAALTRGVIPSIDRPVALLGIAEKGYVTLELIAQGKGGHTSMPLYDTAVTRLARGIVKLQQNPFDGGIEGVVSEMLNALGPEFPFAVRAVIANQWLYGSLIERAISRRYRAGAVGTKELNALLRTTIAPTMLEGSPKENVLGDARATVNFRIHPRDSVESVLEHVRSLIDDPNVSVKIASSFAGGRNPTPVSVTDSEGYKTIKRTTQEVFPEATVVPALVVVGGTDSGHYADMAEGVYRFGPFVLGSEDLEGIHGFKGSVLVDPQGIWRWLTWWQALGMASPDLRLPLVWNGDIQRRDDLVAKEPLRSVAWHDIYAPFLDWAEAAGRTFYPFAYDWRRDNLESVDKFVAFLKTVSDLHGGVKVQVVDHSMGGLISFVALNRSPELFHSVLFAGVPFGPGIDFLEDMHVGTAIGLNKRILSPQVLFTFVSRHSFFPWETRESALLEQTGDSIPHDWYSADDWERQKLGIFAMNDAVQVTGQHRTHLRMALRRASEFRRLLVSKEEKSFQYPPIAVLASDRHPTLATVVRDGPRAVRGWDFYTAPKQPGDNRVEFPRAMPPEGVPYAVHKTAHEHGDLLNDTRQVAAILAQLSE